MQKYLRVFSIVLASLFVVFIIGCSEQMTTVVETVVDPPTDSVTPPMPTDQGYDFQGSLDHQGTIHAVAFSPDRQTLSSLGEDSLKLWNPHTKELKDTFPLEMGFRWIIYLPNGEQRIGGPDQLPAYVTGHTSIVRAFAYNSIQQLSATGSSDKTTRVWNTQTGAHKYTLEHEGQVYTVAFSRDGQTLATGGGFEGIYLWDADTGQSKGAPLIASTAQVEGIAFGPNGQTLLVATGKGDGEAIHVWDLRTNTRKDTLMAEGYTIRKVAISPDGKLIAGGAYFPGGPGVLLWKAK